MGRLHRGPCHQTEPVARWEDYIGVLAIKLSAWRDGKTASGNINVRPFSHVHFCNYKLGTEIPTRLSLFRDQVFLLKASYCLDAVVLFIVHAKHLL